jgi:hypothetical protein
VGSFPATAPDRDPGAAMARDILARDRRRIAEPLTAAIAQRALQL